MKAVLRTVWHHGFPEDECKLNDLA
jgi:hypothetical protein